MLRHQLNVLRRKSPQRIIPSAMHRLIFDGLYALVPVPRVLNAVQIVKPDTVIGWRRCRAHPASMVSYSSSIDVGQTTVAEYITKRRRPPSQGWKTFLQNHADGIGSLDLFVVPTISFRLLYGVLITCRRELLWLEVTAHPTVDRPWLVIMTKCYSHYSRPIDGGKILENHNCDHRFAS